MIAALSLAACSSAPKPGPPDAAIAATPKISDARAQATASLRCEECHERIARDWSSSPHAAAVRDPIYVSMLAGADGAECARCHAPVRAAVAADDPVAREAIGCDGCHLVQAVDATHTAFRWAEHATTKYGPLCNAEDHYFHKMGCSKLHMASEFCAPCHEWRRTTSAGPLALLTDFSDWKAGSKADEGLECQSCHMPSVNDEIARGGKRITLHEHGFSLEKLVGSAVELDAVIEPGAAGTPASLRVVVKNVGAGHSIPGGMPEHRLLLRVRALDGAGKLLGEEHRSWGRVLADERGTIVPFLRAVRVQSDTRLKVGEARTERIAIAAGAAKLEVSVVVQPIADDLVAALGHADEVMLVAKTVATRGKR